MPPKRSTPPPLPVAIFGRPPVPGSEDFDVQRWRFMRRIVVRGQLPCILVLSAVAISRHIAAVIPVFFLIWAGLVIYTTRRVRTAERPEVRAEF
jgi:hypothetical protein